MTVFELDEKQRLRVRDKLRMLDGLPPYNTGSNLCRGDPYFAAQLVREFGMMLPALREAAGPLTDPAATEAACVKAARATGVTENVTDNHLLTIVRAVLAAEKEPNT